MDAVIEVDKIRKVMDTEPFDRFVRAIAITNGLKNRGLGPDLRVAGHAGLDRRNPGKSCLLYRDMTVAAIDPEPVDVMLMAEWHRLFARDANIVDIGRSSKPQNKRKSPSSKQGANNHADLG